MKRIYIFGLFTRIFMIVSILFVIYLGVDNCVKVGMHIDNITVIVIMFVFLIFIVYWQWAVGIFVKGDRLLFLFHLRKGERYERSICNIQSIELRKEKNRGFNFKIAYKNGTQEELFYRFYRISFVESIQYRRIQKKLIKLNKIFME